MVISNCRGCLLAPVAVSSTSTTARDGLKRGRFNPLYVPEIEAHARAARFGMRVVSWQDARPGDFVTFNWDGGVPDALKTNLATG